MESNVLRWSFHTTTADNPNALTILIEGKPLSLFVGYRVATRVQLFNRDFSSLFKCILMTKYLKIDYGDTRKYTRGLSLSENLYDLEFRSDATFSPIMCVRDKGVFYLNSNKICSPLPPTPLSILAHPSFDEFVDLMDINLVLNFMIHYLKQSNLKIFGHIFISIIKEWTDAYKELDKRDSPIQFYKQISPTIGDFFLFHAVVDYVYSLPV